MDQSSTQLVADHIAVKCRCQKREGADRESGERIIGEECAVREARVWLCVRADAEGGARRVNKEKETRGEHWAGGGERGGCDGWERRAK